MDSFSKYLKYKTKYLNLLNKMLQNGGYNCPKCLSEMSPKTLVCVNCGQKQPVVLDQGVLLKTKEAEQRAEEIRKLKNKRIETTTKLLSGSDLLTKNPEDVLDIQEITGVDEPSLVVNIMEFAQNSIKQIRDGLIKDMQIIEYDPFKLYSQAEMYKLDFEFYSGPTIGKFTKNLTFKSNESSPINETFVSLLPDGFAIGGEEDAIQRMWRGACDCNDELECSCPPVFTWLQFVTEKKLSKFIIAHTIFVEKVGKYMRERHFCRTASFLQGMNYHTIVGSGFIDDLPKNPAELQKHKLVAYAKYKDSEAVNDW